MSISATLPDSPFPYVPSHISPEAQEYLREGVPVGGPVSDPSMWSMIRDGFRSVTASVSDEAREKYVQTTEKIQIAGVSVLEVMPKEHASKPASKEKVLIYIHGGAFTLGSSDHLYQIFAPVAQKGGFKAYAIDYRLAPEFPFPAGLEDCVKVYTELLKIYDPKNIVFLGDSAGANLCIAAILKSRDLGLPLPAAVGLNSPLVDASGKNSDTFHSLAGRSPKLSYEKSIQPSMEVYATKEELRNPLISVLNGDFAKGFPPTTIHTGTRDLLLSECARLDRKLKNAGVSSSLEVWEGMWHGFQEHRIPEAEDSTFAMAAFLKGALRA